MFCVYCGKQIADDSQFCPECGKPLKQADGTGMANKTTAPISPAGPSMAPKAGVAAWKVVVGIVAAVVVAAGLGIGAYFLVNHFMPSEQEAVEEVKPEKEKKKKKSDAEEEKEKTEEQKEEVSAEENTDELREESAEKKEIKDVTGKSFPDTKDISRLLDAFLFWTQLQFNDGRIVMIDRLTVQQALPMAAIYVLSTENTNMKYGDYSEEPYNEKIPAEKIEATMEDLFGKVYDLKSFRQEPIAKVKDNYVYYMESDFGDSEPLYQIRDITYYDDDSFTVTVRYYCYYWQYERESHFDYTVYYDCAVDTDKPAGFIITDMHTDPDVAYIDLASEFEEENNDYIIPDSNSRKLTEYDLIGMTKDELRLARNEIYARHGRRFQSKDLQEYFDSKSWYFGTIEPNDWSEKLLNSYETYNVNFISDCEKRMK